MGPAERGQPRAAPTLTSSRLLPVALLKPVLCSTVGIDGGAIFQIIAIQNLGISAAALGISFGFGVVSVPFQLAAARMLLRRARPNLQWFLIVAGLQAWAWPLS